MSFTGLGSLIGSFIGGNDLEDAFEHALNELRAFRGTATDSLRGFRKKGAESFERAKSELVSPTMAPDVAAVRQSMLTDLAGGLSPYATLLFEDLNRELEGIMSRQGNLRSGAHIIRQTELARRVAADEFQRDLQAVDVFQRADIVRSGQFLQASQGFGQLESIALNTIGEATARMGEAFVGKGAVQQQRSVALGAFAGGVFDEVERMYQDYFMGGAVTNKLQ